MAVKRQMKMYVSPYCTFLYIWEDDDKDDDDKDDDDNDDEDDDDNDDEDNDDDGDNDDDDDASLFSLIRCSSIILH